MNTAAADADANNTNEEVIFKNFAPFTNRISRINNTQIDDAQYIDLVMPMYDLIEYSDDYSKRSGLFLQYCRDVPAADNNATDSFNLKKKIKRSNR